MKIITRATVLAFLCIAAFAQIPLPGGGSGGGGLSSVTINGTSGSTFTYTTGSDSCIDWTSPFAPVFNFACLMSRSNTWTGRQDASTASSTAPIKVGTTAPATCAVGDMFYDSDATVGRNLYACTSANTWTLQGDGGYTTSAHWEFYHGGGYNTSTSTSSFGGWSGTFSGISGFYGLGGNQAMYGMLFNSNSTSTVYYSTILPDTWDGNSLPIKLYVGTDSSSASGTVYFTVYSLCPTQSTSSQQMNQSYTFSNSVALSQAVTSTYARFTISGTLPMTGCSAGVPVTYKIQRIANSGSDTLNNSTVVFGMAVSVTY